MSRKKYTRSKRAAPCPLVPTSLKSLKAARRINSRFHRIHRQLELSRQKGTTVQHFPAKESQCKELLSELHSCGGRQAYQEASLLTTTRHRTCKWIFAILTKLGLRPSKEQPPLRVLEVGAVNTQLLCVPWLAVRAIDIKAQHPKIEQINFFDLQPSSNYDAVVLSMVLNSVSSPLKRGQMLSLARSHLIPGGHMFLMVPRSCVERSESSSVERLPESLSFLGMKAYYISPRNITGTTSLKIEGDNCLPIKLIAGQISFENSVTINVLFIFEDKASATL